ncbi:hypothetical protein RDABS01_030842 [Bienertia sinuspersici]
MNSPICRTVEDAAYVLESIVGYDTYDSEATAEGMEYIPHGGYAQFLKLDGLKGKTIGIIRNPFFDDIKECVLQNSTYEQHFHTETTNGIGMNDKKALATLAEWSKGAFEKVMEENKLDAMVKPESTFSSVLVLD